MKCEHCEVEAEPGSNLCGYCECDERNKARRSLAPVGGSELPSVAGRMEMTHADFQRACQVMLEEIQQNPNCDTRMIYLLCEAVRCSRECCRLATHGLAIPNERAEP